MNSRLNLRRPAFPPEKDAAAELAGPRRSFPPRKPRRGFRAFLGAVPWRLVLVLTGFVVQGVLTWMMWQLVDLSISLMEVWAELARKHLELTL